jgi:hypothetical protein
MTRVDPVPGEPRADLPLLVLHIPRTGGSTLKFMLRTTFGQARTLLDAHWFRIADEDLGGYAVVEGHLGVEFFARKFGAGWCANGITLLREPVARTVSQARHIRARPGPLQEQLLARIGNPAELFERIPTLGNAQTKHLSRTPLDAAVVGEGALAEAKATLDQLAFGLTESFDSSIALLIERFRLGVPKFDVANVSAGTHDDDLLSEEFRAAAAEHNEFDRRLHDYATTLLSARIASYTESLLAVPADECPLTCGLRYRSRPVDGAIRVPARDVTARFSGWALLDGHAADAALVRVGDRVTPLVPGIERDDAARRTHDLDNRNAGVIGTLTIPAGAESIELIAFDRARGRRASQVVEVTRVEPEPLVARSATAVKSRFNKLLGR